MYPFICSMIDVTYQAVSERNERGSDKCICTESDSSVRSVMAFSEERLFALSRY